MRKGKVNFLWDVGSGVGRVEYPDLVINDGNWHRIEASRVGLNGSISVRALEGPKAGIMPTWHSANAPESYTVLDVDQNAYLFVGGMLGNVKKADAVKTITFSGCMGETYLDGKPIGLWNYRERDGDCKGCVVSPQPADSEGTVQFDGEGYAAVSRPTRWNPNVSTVMFKFRTFSTNALMMYLATKDMKDFMSVELSDGRVKVSYDLGSGTGSIISEKRHNDGRWKSLTMSRSRKEGTVTILDMDSNVEEKLYAESQGGATGLNLKEDERIYFGGLPTIGNYRPEVTLRRYAGCLKDIEVSRTPYNLLSSSDYTGLTKGCSIENLHTVSFPRPGYMELSPMVFDVGSEITLSFSTKSENGIILFGRGGVTTMTQISQNRNLVQIPRRNRRQTGEPFISVQLNKGSLEVLVFTGSRNPRRALRKPEEGILHDGREHSLRIRRHREGSFSVQVDEETRMEQALPSDHPISIHRLFIGGVPADLQTGLQRPSVPFEGCIWNLLINTVKPLVSSTRAGACDLYYTALNEGVLAHNPCFVIHRIFRRAVPQPTRPHPIRVRRDKQRGILTVDNRYSKHTVSPKKADILDVVGMLYVGGLPLNYTTKRIGPVVYSINGCIRNFRMLNVDMENPTSSYRVGSCFANPQPGTYFDGTGYAKAVPTYRVGNDVSVDVEFRTSTNSGVLLGISSQKMDGLGIELVNGKLLFHADNGVGRVTAVYEPVEGAGLCDGQWHSVSAHKLKHRLELIVDGVKSEAASPDPRSASADTNDPVYVGGYPESLKQFGLTISTPFKGCMRNLKLTKAGKVLEVQLNKALEIKGVQPLTCPGA
ncbi:hypothetical protein AOLI_G00040280 [Acnodon oligacanthus]